VLTPENSEPLRERRHAAANGVLVVSVPMDRKGRIAGELDVRAIGLPGDADYPLEDALDDLCDEAEQALKRIPAEERGIDESVETALSRAVKKAAYRIWERRPVVETTVLRV
jgi:ribonuclease J